MTAFEIVEMVIIIIVTLLLFGGFFYCLFKVLDDQFSKDYPRHSLFGNKKDKFK